MINSASSAVSKQLTVLYVEDDNETRQELALYLKRRVGRLLIATNGKEALRYMEQETPHLVITDLKMPEMDGLSMIRQMRKSGRETPVIITSALSDAETIIEAVDVGILHYVVKPINLEELMDQMQKIGKDILMKNSDMIVLGQHCLLDADQVAEVEMKIRSEMAHFLKKQTGKGPRDVHVAIKGIKIEVRLKGCLTKLEEGILVNGRHHSLVDYHRKLFYTENEELLVKQISQVISCAIELEEVMCDSQRGAEKVVFTIR